MTNTIFYLATCSTCSRILKQFNTSKFTLREIKTEKMSAQELDDMKELAGSYLALFSKRALKYKEMNLAKKQLSEAEIRELILDEYTFLKRPVFVMENKIFIGNAAKTVEEALLFAASQNLV